MTVLLISLLAFTLVGVTCLPIYFASRSGRLRRNRAIGIKTRATLASDEAWRRAHLAAAPWILSAVITAFGGALACATLMLVLGDSVSNVAIATICLFGFGGLLGILVTAGSVASRAARG